MRFPHTALNQTRRLVHDSTLHLRRNQSLLVSATCRVMIKVSPVKGQWLAHYLFALKDQKTPMAVSNGSILLSCIRNSRRNPVFDQYEADLCCPGVGPNVGTPIGIEVSPCATPSVAIEVGPDLGSPPTVVNARQQESDNARSHRKWIIRLHYVDQSTNIR